MAYKRVVVGVDGSDTASRALMEAAGLAKTERADLLIVSAYTAPDTTAMTKWQEETPDELSWRVTASAVVEDVLQRAKSMVQEKIGIEPQTRSEEGDPADCIISVAHSQNADLIVVGNRGMSGAKRFLLGNVPNKISHNAPCDVLIVKTV